MYILIGLVGALIGARTAKKHNGNIADILQYAVGFGLLFGILGLMVTIFLDRTVI
jgi:uncharacterized membrane protein YeaQ/YmgE (transglycosylase-associated protein family)